MTNVKQLKHYLYICDLFSIFVVSFRKDSLVLTAFSNCGRNHHMQWSLIAPKTRHIGQVSWAMVLILSRPSRAKLPMSKPDVEVKSAYEHKWLISGLSGRSLSRFYSTKQLGVFLLRLEWMLVHRRKTSSIKFYTPGWREVHVLIELSILSKNRTKCPWPGLKPWTARSRDERNNHRATVPSCRGQAGLMFRRSVPRKEYT